MRPRSATVPGGARLPYEPRQIRPALRNFRLVSGLADGVFLGGNAPSTGRERAAVAGWGLRGRSATGAYTSMCEPMMTVRSRGRPKYSAASAVMYEVAMKSRLRHGAMVAALPRRSSIFDRK